MRAFALVTLLFVVFAALGACEHVRADEGLDASLHVAGAQFYRGDMPADQSGPGVRSVTVAPHFFAGDVNRSCSGELAPQATAVALGLAGDLGYWIVRADVPSAAALDAPTFAASMSFARDMAPGRRDLVVRAVDGAGRFGPPSVSTIDVSAHALPDGVLVVSLAWDDSANLDLHVVDPTGVEIFNRNINSYQAPAPGTQPPGASHDGGILDFDSNASCVLDDRDAENVVWTDPPPSGHYLVRVDTFSLCGEPAARWRVQVLLRGQRIATAEGISTPSDTQFAHVRGAGVLAVEFDVP